MAISSNGDKYFSNVSLLLPFDGANGSTTFYDASTKLNAISNPNSLTLDSSKSKFGGSSLAFPGATNKYLYVTDGNFGDFGANDFTIDLWAYFVNSGNSIQGIFSKNSSAQASHYSLRFNKTTGILSFYIGTTQYSFTSTLTFDAWHHIAIQRSSGTLKFFTNGIKDSAEFYNTTAIGAFTGSNFILGSTTGVSSSEFNGYIDSFRVTEGVARYSSNFAATIPFPTDWEDVADPYYDNVVLHLPMDGPENTYTFIDRSKTPKTIGGPNAAYTTKTQSKFGGSSGYFTPVFGYKQITYSSDLDLTSGDFTIEAWLYPTRALTSGQSSTFIGSYASSTIWNGTTGWHWLFEILPGYTIRYSSASGTTNISVTSTEAISLNTWNFVQISVSGTTGYIGVNGIVTSSSLSGRTTPTSTPTIYFGGTFPALDSAKRFEGYIDSLRITKGVARYTSNFTVPTGPFAIGKPYVADAYASNVKLLLTGSGAHGTQAFRDESGLNKVITVAGNTYVDRNRSKVGGGSAYFDGIGDYLTASGTTDYMFGTGDFTIECWFWKNSGGTGGDIPICRYGLTGSAATNGTWEFNVQTNNLIGFYWNYYTSSSWLIPSTGITNNTWNHIAVTRSSGTLTIYVNGVAVGSVTNTTDLNYASGTLFIGATTANTSQTYYINSLRITKGTARYTANFTPDYSYLLPPLTSTTVIGDPYYDNVALLLNFNGSNGSTTFKDTSKYNRTLTPTSAEISTVQSKFGGASGHLTATGGSLIVPSNSEINFNGTFTLEFWIYVTAYPATVSYFFGATNNAGNYLALTSAGVLSITSGSTLNIGTISLNQWTHVAITQNATSRFVFKDGTLTASVSAGSTDQSTRDTDIFGLSYNFSNYHLTATYLDDLRFTRGIARYTSSFTPPTSEFLLSGDYLYDNTVLTLRLDGNYIDSSPKNNTVTAYGNASLSASTYKYGTGSLSLDGIGDYIATPDSTNFRFGTGDFCIECWVYPTTLKTINAIVDHQVSSGIGWNITIGGSYLKFNYSGGVKTGSIAISANVWTHIAVSRTSGQVSLFVNGVLDGAASTVSLDFTDASTYLAIGAFVNNRNSSFDFQGYIDNVRITKGAARYTTTFTPADIESPTAAGPVRAYSLQSITSNGAVKFTIPVAGVIQAGFSTNASTDITKNDLEYSIQIDSSKVLTIVESGTVKATKGTASDGTNFEIEYSGTTMTYKSNGAQLLTTTVTAGMTLYFSAFIEDTGLYVTGIQIGTYANDGTPGNISGQITAGNISTYISSVAIGEAYIANAAITNAKIANAAITNAKIGNLEVDTLKLANNAATHVFSAKTTGATLAQGASFQYVLDCPVSITTALDAYSAINAFFSCDYFPVGGNAEPSVSIVIRPLFAFSIYAIGDVCKIIQSVNSYSTNGNSVPISLCGTANAASNGVYLPVGDYNISIRVSNVNGTNTSIEMSDLQTLISFSKK